jgi:pimeloyl-ACP methyl ester carboxylesterase
MTIETVAANGLKFRCLTAGKGPLVFLLHGFPQTSHSWRGQLGPLSEKFRVVAPDLRGYGGSDKPSAVAAYSLPRLVEDLAGLIAAFGERRARIVGHDWGGAVAWATAVERPDLVEKLAVLNCPHPAKFLAKIKSSPRQLLRSWYMGFFQIPLLPELLAPPVIGSLLKNSAASPSAFSDEDLRIYKEAFAQPGAARAAINYYRAAFRDRNELERVAAAAPKIKAPTLLLWGEKDQALGVDLTDGMEPLFAGPFALKKFPDASHWLHEEKPNEVNAALLQFLA